MVQLDNFCQSAPFHAIKWEKEGYSHYYLLPTIEPWFKERLALRIYVVKTEKHLQKSVIMASKYDNNVCSLMFLAIWRKMREIEGVFWF